MVLANGVARRVPKSPLAFRERFGYPLAVYTTTVRQRTTAPRAAVYRACLDPRAVSLWMVPDGMRSEVHTFHAVEGGELRISLTYESSTEAGKTHGSTDTFRGRFVRLVPDQLIIQTVEFETASEVMQGEMRITISLSDLPEGGTEIEYRHEGVPDAISASDNELGTRVSLAKLAALAERA